MNKNAKIIILGSCYSNSRQNGLVFSAKGISPTISAGTHAGVEPRIVVYE